MATSFQIPRMIDEHLLLRRSTKADADRLGKFYTSVFKLMDGSQDMGFIPLVNDMLNGTHPTFCEDDFTIIEDTSSGEIVSAMNLISQTWTYDGIPFKVGRPEAVATAPAYRNRGLVRMQFDVVHEWSRERGELVLGITGIPFYYRLFGYEMCVDMEGGYLGYPETLPKLTDAQKQAYRVRVAEEKDISFIDAQYRRDCERLLLACQRDERLWRYEISGRCADNDERKIICIIESSEGETLGFCMHLPYLGPDYLDDQSLGCFWYGLKPGVPYPDVTPVVLQYLLEFGQNYAREADKTCRAVGLWLEDGHPALAGIKDYLPRRKDPYAWYMRVPDLPAFLRYITPALERRLQKSCCDGYTGDLNLSFYRNQLRLSFKSGKLLEVVSSITRGEEGCQAAFPGHTFLHLLFGYRTLAEVEYMFPDCWVEEPFRPLIEALFPRCPSNIWAIH